EALHAVHRAGVIHRDLKPSNVLVSSDGPWIIDFGIARAADATQLTRSGGLIGTPQFMSPEHAGGQDLTPATDVFSLGLIAAVAATGRHPYGDHGAITLATRIANTEFRPPDLSAYPEPLRTVLERTLAADPAARPTPSELAELCQESVERPLRDFTGWLPAPVAADIAGRERLARERAESEPGPDPSDDSPALAATVPPDAAVVPPPGAAGFSPSGAAVNSPSGAAAFSPSGAAGNSPSGAAGNSPSGAAADTVPPGTAAPAGYTPTQPSRPAEPPQPPTGPATPSPSPSPSFQGAPPPAAAPARPRSRTPLAVGAAALAVVVVAAAAWVFTRDDDKDSDAQQSGSSSAPVKSSAPTDTASSAAESPTPTGASAGYTEIFKDKPLTLRAQFTSGASSYTNVDLDAPAIDTHASSSTTGAELQYAEWGTTHPLHFVTTTGKSAGATPEQCAEGAATDALPSELSDDVQGEELTKGTLLCTVTDEGNLAMLEIKDVVVQQNASGSKARDYVTGLTLWKAP
ncbi:serine/threonine protein kinase, partial [Streptomyces sp. NPDC002920]